MSNKARNITLSVVATLSICFALVMGVWTSSRESQGPCKGVYISVLDSAERSFVTAERLYIYLQREGLSIKGKNINTIDCDTIEKCLLKHSLIRTAQCYKSPQNNVYIRVTQCIPVVYVITNEGCYYVDSDRRILQPQQSIRVKVLTMEGNIGKRAATQEYYDFAEWISHHDYWNTRISKVQVNNPRNIVLLQKGDYPSRILLGSLDGYPQKMDKLEKLYTHGLDIIEHPQYREYDLRFSGQVIGRK